MEQNSSVRSIMTKKVICVDQEMPLIKAAGILLNHNFNGLPVVNSEKTVIGILTDYDLTIKGSMMHLPTFLKLLNEFKIYKRDKKLIKDDIKKILGMKVKDAMNPDPLLINENASLEELGKIFSEHHRVNPIPVVSGQNKIVGIVSRFDLIKLFDPAFSRLDEKTDDRQLDKNINKFLDNFEKKFIMVSRVRTELWLVVSFLFIIVGFLIALFMLVDFSI